MCLGLTGCCSIVPFIKCESTRQVVLKWTADADSNNKRSVQAVLFVLTGRETFMKCSSKVVFDPKSDPTTYSELGIIDSTSFTMLPGEAGSVVFNVSESDADEIDMPVYLGIIANYASPDTDDAGRVIFPLGNVKFPLEVSLRSSRDRLSGWIAGK